MAASEARRCFHKREDTRKMRERERGRGVGRAGEKEISPIYRYLEISGRLPPARHSSNPMRTSQIGGGTDIDERTEAMKNR